MKDNHNSGDNPTVGEKSQQPGNGHKKYVFFIDRDKYETDQATLTARQILTDFARVDSTKNTLAVKENGSFNEITNMDNPIQLKEGMHFTIFNNEPTTVS